MEDQGRHEDRRSVIKITEMDGGSYLVEISCGALHQTVAASNMDHMLQRVRAGFEYEPDAIPMGVRPNRVLPEPPEHPDPPPSRLGWRLRQAISA